MFLVLPTGHDERVVRRFPFWTALILLVNVLVWGATLVRERNIERHGRSLILQAAQLAGRNPDFEVSEELARAIASDGRALWTFEHPQGARESGDRATLIELDERIIALQKSDVRTTNAFGRHHNGSYRALASLFTHASWLHVLFNLWFLWLTGAALEERWGRIFYPVFYLAGGLVAGLAQAQVSDIPAIGASGAIAALMGAFAVQLPLTKIRLLVAGLLPIPVAVRGEYGAIVPLLRIPPVSLTWLKLRVPAFVLLMLWGGLEVYNGVTNVSSGVGHWAHAGGFAFGVAVALVVRLFGVDEKISRSIDDQGGVVSPAALLEAARLTDAGRPGIAVLRLRKLLENPELNRFDVSLELLRAAEAAGSRADRCVAYANLIEHSARAGSTSSITFFEEAVAAGLEAELPWRARILVARELARASRAHEAHALLERIVAEAPESEGARQAATVRRVLVG